MLIPHSLGWSVLHGVFLSLFSAAAFAQVAGDSASGTLQIAKNRFALKCVFAVMEADPDDKEMLTVFLSDVPVPDEMRKASDNWREWARGKAVAGTIHGVVVTINPATGVWDHGAVLTRQGFMFYSETVSGEARGLRFEPAAPVGDLVAGKLSMKEPRSGMSDADGPWLVDAQFHSAVVRRSAVSGVLTGPAALSSPQYKAVLAFLEACRKKDLDAIRDSVEPQGRESLAQMFAGPSKAEALDMFAKNAAETLALKLAKVTVRGDSADVDFVGAKPADSQGLKVVLSGGEWKVGL